LCNLNIPQAINAILGSKIYVGNDTGFMHICGSLDIKTFGIFGDTPSDYCAYNNKIIPIMPIGYSQVNFNDNAMNLIKPDFVFNEIVQNI